MALENMIGSPGMSRRDMLKLTAKAAGTGLAAYLLYDCVAPGKAHGEMRTSGPVQVAQNYNGKSVLEMYEWDDTYITSEDLQRYPASKGPSKTVDLDLLNVNLGHLVRFFHDGDRLKETINRLIDNEISNEEMSSGRLTNDYLFFRIVTQNDSVSQMRSMSKRDIEKYGSCFFYIVAMRIPPQYLNSIASLLVKQ